MSTKAILMPNPPQNRPQISEAAVVGLPSEQWGQKVAAVVVLSPEYVGKGSEGGSGGKEREWGVMDMRRALKDRLVGYKMPQEMKVMKDGLPRNAMGKGEWDSFFSFFLS